MYVCTHTDTDTYRSRLPHHQRDPPEQAVHGDDDDQDADPFPRAAPDVAVLLEHAAAADLAPGREVRPVHTVAAGPARVDAAGELVDHHALEDVGLVVDVVEHVLPERVEDGRRHEEPADAHPQAVGERDKRQGDDEVREERRHEHDERLGRDEVQEEPHHPGEEGGCVRAEVGQPVRDDREEDRDDDCIFFFSLCQFCVPLMRNT